MKNSIYALNLYSKIEDLIGVKEVAPKLYAYYFDILSKFEFCSLLDIGCGKGDFLLKLSKIYKSINLEGIDRSSAMVEHSLKKGLNVSFKELSQIDREFDIATATFDMVNYLNPQEFIEFFEDLKKVLKKNALFIFDLNSEFGLSELAVGNFIADDNDRFLTIESFYEKGLYESIFTLFEKDKNLYKKSTDKIRQYYYSSDFLTLLNGWHIEKRVPIKLYDENKYDKIIYIFKNI